MLGCALVLVQLIEHFISLFCKAYHLIIGGVDDLALLIAADLRVFVNQADEFILLADCLIDAIQLIELRGVIRHQVLRALHLTLLYQVFECILILLHLIVTILEILNALCLGGRIAGNKGLYEGYVRQ